MANHVIEHSAAQPCTDSCRLLAIDNRVYPTMPDKHSLANIKKNHIAPQTISHKALSHQTSRGKHVPHEKKDPFNCFCEIIGLMENV